MLFTDESPDLEQRFAINISGTNKRITPPNTHTLPKDRTPFYLLRLLQ